MKEGRNLTILIIDGQGGGIGKGIIEQLRRKNYDDKIIAVGTNSIATSAMLKAGADAGATGENPVIYNSSKADIIAGPIGIISANSMYGEISPQMAQAVSESKAHKILIPISKSNIHIISTTEKPMQAYIEETAECILNEICNKNNTDC